MDVLARLERRDKWFLGGGKGAIYAPPFPKNLATPGFWDECYLADIRLSRLFCVLLLNDRARPLDVSSRVEKWQPDLLVLMHEGPDLVLRERRTVLECNAWVSELELLSGPPADAFMWSLQDVREPGYGTPWSSLVNCSVSPSAVEFEFKTVWPEELEPDRTAVESEVISAASGAMGEGLSVFLSLGADAPRASQTVNLAQRHDDAPLYQLSVLSEKFSSGKLPGDFKLRVGPDPEGLLHMVQHYRLEKGRPVQFACGSGLSAAAARASMEEALAGSAIEKSEKAWRAYFASVPQFSSPDPFLTNAYWYRWYGLRLNTVDMADLPLERGPEARKSGSGKGLRLGPFVTEGIGFFRNFITYSAQAHLREVAWMHDPNLAIGILDNLTKIQREDGSFPGHNYSCRPARDFYHADFATGFRHVKAIHGRSRDEWFQTLERYADYLYDHRGLGEDPRCDDPLVAQLTAILDQNETGQEYMSRYQFATPRADQWASFRVGGVDATVYAALLYDVLWPSPSGTEREDGWSWLDVVGQVTAALSFCCWSDEDQFFADMTAHGRRSPARPATGFYPLLIAEQLPYNLEDRPMMDRMAEGVRRWLLSADEFYLPKAFPATALSDTTFSAEAEWKDKRQNCPWNGRSWPMVNSHLVDGLANLGRQIGDDGLKLAAAGALRKAIRLMFHDGDPTRPNSYEHYNPFTGTPALYRGYDDYMHSWIVDLILRHAVGVQPGKTEVDPLPLGVEIECSDIPYPQGRMDVRVKGGVASVDVRRV